MPAIHLAMSTSTFPPVSALPSLDTHQRAAVLDTLFEPCDQLHTLSVDTLHRQAFESYDDMIASIGVQMSALAESTSTSDTVWLDAILAAHPRLGAAKVDSAQSRAEQAQLNQGGSQEVEMLTQLNQQYEETFPGLRYVYGRRVPSLPHD